MGKQWGVVVGVALAFSISGIAAAQQDYADNEKDQQLETILKRLDALEHERAQREADALNKEEHGADSADKWYDKVHIGGGIRTEFRTSSHGAPDGNGYSQRFSIDNARLYVGANINSWLSATLDTEFTATPAVLDAICQAHISDAVNIYAGRLLPATDRSNFDGPFYLSSWDFPFLSDSFNSTGKTADRDDGFTVWGDIEKFKYWAGLYDGQQHFPPAGAPIGAHLLWAARVQYDIFDDEKGYYLQSTYYGSKKILAVALAANYQDRAGGAGTGFRSMGDVEFDVLYEETMPALSGGVLTVEFAYYYFGRHGFDNLGTNGVSGLDTGAGDGILLSVAFLIPGKVGWGEFQPVIRYQGFDSAKDTNRAPVSTNARRWDVGVNYVMEGHNARISLFYTHESFGRGFSGAYAANEFDAAQTAHATGMIALGTQFQF